MSGSPDPKQLLSLRAHRHQIDRQITKVLQEHWDGLLDEFEAIDILHELDLEWTRLTNEIAEIEAAGFSKEAK